MSNPKRHHFVPRDYLKGFTEPNSGYLNLYSKRADAWRRQKPEKVMVRNKYYKQHWAPQGTDKNVLEKNLGQYLEPNGLASLRKLIDAPESITDDDTAYILGYLEFQRLRVPRQAEMAKELMKDTMTLQLLLNPLSRAALKHNRLEIKDSFRFEFMRMLTGSLTPYMSRMTWIIARVKRGLSLLTSDSPVAFFNREFPPPLEAGVGLYGTSVLFPVDSMHMLAMFHPEYLRGEREPSEKLPNEPQIEGGHIDIKPCIVWDRKAVDHYNWITYQLSGDLVAGPSKEAIDAAVGKETRGH